MISVFGPYEIAEMRRQIAEMKAEAARADGEDKDAGRS
jgi:hypothetical protein